MKTQNASGIKGKLTATLNRHLGSTRFEASNPTDKDRTIFANYLGHSARINKTIYQAPQGQEEATLIGKFYKSRFETMTSEYIYHHFHKYLVE